MNFDQLTSPEADFPPSDPAGDRAASGCGRDDAGDAAWLKRRAALLERLAERGVDVVEALPALAKAQSRLAEAVTECLRGARPEGRAALGELAVTLHQGNVDFALMYERISRSVRRCIAMREQAPPLRASAAGARDGANSAGPRPRASGERAETQRDPESQAARDLAAGRMGEVDAERPERLFDDLHDRPEDPTGMADLGLDRPMRELVAEICADFGVDGKIWAERLGLGDEAMEIPPAKAKRRTGGPPHTAPFAAEDRNRRPPDNPVSGDAGRVADIGLSGPNRRERRAALKLARRSHPSPNHRQRESGRGPP